ncbi:hypothetical protein [Kyrpidia sp.]|uniref:hypothetical protein n=1 Tax=Kyrpidia sp. TaxID=2073077 RepID=UPI002587DD5D|nr:hypothetical protein [Kyrpidia sp.]MCL6575561.1 hypothetical protein [Kyrpidia sp.]
MRDHLEKVRELHNMMPTMYTEMKKYFDEDVAKVSYDRTLSEEGKMMKRKEVREQHKKKILEFAKTAHEFQKKELEALRQKASKVLNQPTPKADDLTLERFRNQLADVKASIILRPKTGGQKLIEFAKSVDHPYIAEQLRREIPDLMAMCVDYMSRDEKIALTDELDSLRHRFITPEQREAQEMLEVANQYEKAALFSPILLDNISGNFGHNVASAVNDYDAVAKALGEGE